MAHMATWRLVVATAMRHPMYLQCISEPQAYRSSNFHACRGDAEDEDVRWQDDTEALREWELFVKKSKSAQVWS